MRSTMSEDRQSGLAMMQLHKRKLDELDFNELVTRFASLHPPRMLMDCVLVD